MRNNNLNAELKAVISKYPTLSFEDKSKFVLKGWLPLYDKAGRCFEEFYIVIDFKNYPSYLPTVFELSDRIPVDINRHKYEDKSLCLMTIFEGYLYLEKKETPLMFIKNVVIKHLAMQVHYNEVGSYPIGDRSHGNEGLLESLQEILNISDTYLLYKIIYQYLSNGDATLNKTLKSACFCNSNKKFKHCHLNKIKKLSLFPKEILRKIIILIDFKNPKNV